MTSYKDQLSEAVTSINEIVARCGSVQGEACAKAAQPIVDWVRWYRAHHWSESGSELLDGTRAAVLEAVGYVSLGLGRAAIASIRTQLDLVLGYSFFREHPAEWRRVSETGDGFKLKSELVKYHREMQSSFGEKLSMIEQGSGIRLDDVYRVLSAHIHGQSKYSIPKCTELKQLVWPEKRLSEVVVLQDRAAKALSNFLLSVHARAWTELPPAFVAAGKRILTDAQRKRFFE